MRDETQCCTSKLISDGADRRQWLAWRRRGRLWSVRVDRMFFFCLGAFRNSSSDDPIERAAQKDASKRTQKGAGTKRTDGKPYHETDNCTPNCGGGFSSVCSIRSHLAAASCPK